MINFNDCNLYMSLRSPFARRVRLAFLEHEIPFQTTTMDVFNPSAEFAKVNPLLRVPAVMLKSGEVIIDSHAILDGFYRSQPLSPLVQKRRADVEMSLKWSGIAIGLSELLVQFYLETQREKGKQDENVFEELQAIFERTIVDFEREIKGREFITSQGLSQADLDMGTALTYLKLRWKVNALGALPSTTKYLEGLNKRPSFQATIPPA